jgi:cell division protein FtsA
MVGYRLEASVHVVTASVLATRNIVTAVNRAGIEVLDTVYEAFAAADACLTTDERELGVALLDLGAASSELVVYRQGAVWHTASIPVGGEHFTNDIAVGLCTPIPEAERMKRSWGEHVSAGRGDVNLEVPGVGDRPTRHVNYAMLTAIIQPRATELLELALAELTHSGLSKQLGAGMVLTGGGAKLGGLANWAMELLNCPVRVARPTSLLRMGDSLPDPSYATVVGLVVYGNRLRLSRGQTEHAWGNRIWRVIRSKLVPS